MHGNVFISLAGTQEHTETCLAVCVNPAEWCQSCVLQVTRACRWSEVSSCSPCLLWALCPLHKFVFLCYLRELHWPTSASVYLQECSGDLQGSKCERSQISLTQLCISATLTQHPNGITLVIPSVIFGIREPQYRRKNVKVRCRPWVQCNLIQWHGVAVLPQFLCPFPGSAAVLSSFPQVLWEKTR